MVDTVTIRSAAAHELPLVLEFIRELAVYERLEHEVTATTADLATSLLGPHPYAEVVFACLDGIPVGFERGCARLDWAVLDWNAPSIAFYRSVGAVAQDEWTVMRVSGTALEHLARG